MTTLDIYNLLIDAGIDAKKAEPLAKEIVTRDMMADKIDQSFERVENKMRAELYRALLIHGFITVTTLAGLWKLFG